MSIESTHSRSWVNERAYPDQTGGGVAGGTLDSITCGATCLLTPRPLTTLRLLFPCCSSMTNIANSLYGQLTFALLPWPTCWPPQYSATRCAHINASSGPSSHDHGIYIFPMSWFRIGCLPSVNHFLQLYCSIFFTTSTYHVESLYSLISLSVCTVCSNVHTAHAST